MPYKTIELAESASFPTKIDNIKLTLAQINSIASCYDQVKAQGGVSSPMAICISSFKKSHKKSKKSWVKK